jgi:hypothetical protein
MDDVQPAGNFNCEPISTPGLSWCNCVVIFSLRLFILPILLLLLLLLLLLPLPLIFFFFFSQAQYFAPPPMTNYAQNVQMPQMNYQYANSTTPLLRP